MAKNWYHEVSKDWLKARKNYLTATEIAGLIPEYKRMLKAEEGTISPGFAALWAEKLSIGEVDPASFAAAARGHWMEEPCIDSWNAQRKEKMYHWDDTLIAKGRVCFSPDGMSIEQPSADVEWVAKDGVISNASGTHTQPSFIIEIKSFEPAHHMKCVIADKMDQEQKILVQLATAFYVLDGLDWAELVFFCPGAPISMKAFEYTRDDLKVEIELVEKIHEMYAQTIKQCEELPVDLVAQCNEDEVYKQMVEENQLNRKDNIMLL